MKKDDSKRKAKKQQQKQQFDGSKCVCVGVRERLLSTRMGQMKRTGGEGKGGVRPQRNEPNARHFFHLVVQDRHGLNLPWIGKRAQDISLIAPLPRTNHKKCGAKKCTAKKRRGSKGGTKSS